MILELSSLRKNKIVLSDYPYEWDVRCRILMSDFSHFDIQVLEEILFSPLKISLKKMTKRFEDQEDLLLESLKKLEGISLLSLEEEVILVDKEKRKYFEFELTRFDPEFKPDMEFLQGLLKKVPIHVLPVWYAIPRTSNSIFESIIERCLLTPPIFQRYLSELHLGHPILEGIVQDVLSSQDKKVSSSDLIAKYNLKTEEFEEMIILLEFNFVCCLVFEKEGDHWAEFVTPFHEWKEYLCYLHATEVLVIEDEKNIKTSSSNDFAFIEKMSHLLQCAEDSPLREENKAFVQKLTLTGLARLEEGKLTASEEGKAWLQLPLENRSLYLYRHPSNHILGLPLQDKSIHEAEKCVKRVPQGKWVLFEDFEKGIMVPLGESSQIILKRLGKHWKYTIPLYTEEEKHLFYSVIFDWLYEFGMVRLGTYQEKECFCLTEFGRHFFSD